jgi:hypothetical protein
LDVQNFLFATSQIAQTSLRSILGQKDVDALLANREEVNAELQKIIDLHTEPWGVKVSAVEVKNVDFAPEDAAQGSLGDLGGREEEVLDVQSGLAGVDDAEIDDGVDLDGDVVLGDDVLRLDVHVTTRVSTIFMVCRTGMTQTKPGPLIFQKRPSRRTTPRSYSWRMRRPDAQRTMNPTTKTVTSDIRLPMRFIG